MGSRQDVMDCVHHGFVLMRAGDGQDVGVCIANDIRFRAQTARNDHFAVLGKCLADRVERFLARAIQETTGVDDYEVCAIVVRRRFVAFCLESAKYSFGIDERFWAAEADETDSRRRRHRLDQYRPIDRNEGPARAATSLGFSSMLAIFWAICIRVG